MKIGKVTCVYIGVSINNDRGVSNVNHTHSVVDCPIAVLYVNTLSVIDKLTLKWLSYTTVVDIQYTARSNRIVVECRRC